MFFIHRSNEKCASLTSGALNDQSETHYSSLASLVSVLASGRDGDFEKVLGYLEVLARNSK